MLGRSIMIGALAFAVAMIVAVVPLGQRAARAAEPAAPPAPGPAAPAAPGTPEAKEAPKVAEPAAVPTPTTEEIPRSTLLQEISKGGTIAYVILVMSFIMLGLVIEHIVSVRQEKICPTDLAGELRGYIDREEYDEAIELCNVENNLLTQSVRAGLTHLDAGWEAMNEAMQEVGEEGTLILQQKVSYLSLIGNISPMVGLLGTVDGMVGAFGTIGKMAHVKPAALASCISEALVCTLLGLAVAIPSMCAYQYFSNRAMRVALGTGAIVSAMMERFRPGSR